MRSYSVKTDVADESRGFTLVKCNQRLLSGKAGNHTGFTLLELVIVITIIGIIVTFILVSLARTRDRTYDARVVSAIGQLRPLAETYNSITGDYSSMNTENTEVQRIAENISAYSSLVIFNGIHGGERRYCAYAQVPSDETEAYCVDGPGMFSGRVPYIDVQSSCSPEGTLTCQ